MQLSLCHGFTGAGEDVEAVMERLRTQGSENIALRERQAKLEKDQQVTTQLAVLQAIRLNKTPCCTLVDGVCDLMPVRGALPWW